MAGLLAHDSVFGRLGRDIKIGQDELVVDGAPVAYLSEKDPAVLPWKDLDVSVVVDATGTIPHPSRRGRPSWGGATRVVVSAPCKDADATIVLGVNEDDFDPARHRVISNASCTTNCLAPMIKVLEDNFGVEQGFITTVHAYTGDQMLVDGPHKDPAAGSGGRPSTSCRPRPGRPGPRAGPVPASRAVSTAAPSGCRCPTDRSPTWWPGCPSR